MSTDYYIECNSCNKHAIAFTDMERDPEYLNVMRFLMYHRHFCNASFNIIDEYKKTNKELNPEWEAGDRNDPHRYLLNHVKEVIEKC